LADDLRSICVQKWVCGACSVTIWWKDAFLGPIVRFKPTLNSQCH
jgi:hypothetical protein